MNFVTFSSFRAICYAFIVSNNAFQHVPITVALSYPLPWPPLPTFLKSPPSPIPSMPPQQEIRPRRPIWLPVGAARSYRAPENLMPSEIDDPAAPGMCCPAHRSGWGCDPHLSQLPPLTVVRVGGVFLWLLGHGGGRIRRWRAPQIPGELALLRPTPALAAAPLSHTCTHPQHSPQPLTPTPTHAC